MAGWRARLGVAAAAAALAAGCGDAGPAAPKPGDGPASLPPAPQTGVPPTAAPTPTPAPSGDDGWAALPGGLRHLVPEGWTAQQVGQGMRAAQYALPAAAGDAAGPECRVYYFGPGQGGEVSANVDRWAGQVREPAAPAARGSRTVNGLTVYTLDVSGTYTGEGRNDPGHRLLAAMVVAPDDEKWFFKCVGPAASMAAAEAGFQALCDSVTRP